MLLAHARRVACRAARSEAAACGSSAAAARACAAPLPLLLHRRGAPAWRPASALRASASDAASPADAPAGRSQGGATPERATKQELIDTQPPRGTRDFPPEEMQLRNWLFGHFREARACRSCHTPHAAAAHAAAASQTLMRVR
jgi:hypothetical protein